MKQYPVNQYPDQFAIHDPRITRQNWRLHRISELVYKQTHGDLSVQREIDALEAEAAAELSVGEIQAGYRESQRQVQERVRRGREEVWNETHRQVVVPARPNMDRLDLKPSVYAVFA